MYDTPIQIWNAETETTKLMKTDFQDDLPGGIFEVRIPVRLCYLGGNHYDSITNDKDREALKQWHRQRRKKEKDGEETEFLIKTHRMLDNGKGGNKEPLPPPTPRMVAEAKCADVAKELKRAMKLQKMIGELIGKKEKGEVLNPAQVTKVDRKDEADGLVAGIREKSTVADAELATAIREEDAAEGVADTKGGVKEEKEEMDGGVDDAGTALPSETVGASGPPRGGGGGNDGMPREVTKMTTKKTKKKGKSKEKKTPGPTPKSKQVKSKRVKSKQVSQDPQEEKEGVVDGKGRIGEESPEVFVSDIKKPKDGSKGAVKKGKKGGKSKNPAAMGGRR